MRSVDVCQVGPDCSGTLSHSVRGNRHHCGRRGWALWFHAEALHLDFACFDSSRADKALSVWQTFHWRPAILLIGRI